MHSSWSAATLLVSAFTFLFILPCSIAATPSTPEISKRGDSIVLPEYKSPAAPRRFHGEFVKVPTKRFDLVPAPGEVFWLDSKRIAFDSTKPGERITDESGKLTGYFTVFVWDVEADTLIEGPKFSSNLCIAAGNIRYLRREGTDWIVFQGSWGREVEIRRFRAGDKENREISINRHNCKEFRLSDSPLKDHTFSPLLDEHGYFVGPRSNPSQQTITYLRIDGRSIELSEIPWGGVWNPIYSRYLGAYYFASLGPSAKRGPYAIWLLYPDGKTEKIILPYIGLLHASPKFYPVKGGWVFTTRATVINETGPGEAGLYRFRNGKYDRLSVGMPANAAVSHDGCKVALLHAPDMKHRVFDLVHLCREKEGK